jgi:dTDP-4-dehydrorhamnose 3,5-epimerase
LKVVRTALPEVLLLEPKVFEDARGAVSESYNREVVARAAGIDIEFVQDVISRSRRNVLRGLHYQVVRPQGKLVRVQSGSIFDVAVDLRRSSPTFRRWVSVTLSDADGRMLWIPPGFAHGFLALAEPTVVHYKLTDYRVVEHERTLLWNDPAIGVRWPVSGEPVMNERDRTASTLAGAELYA